MPKILIVDDEKSIRITLGEFLKRAGYDTLLAEDADEALALLAEHQPNVVLSDIILPGMAGTNLVQRIHEQFPAVKSILMTGEPTAQTAAEAVRAGAVDYLMKPVSKHTVLNAVATAVRIARLEADRTELQESNKRYAELLENQIDTHSTKVQESGQQLRDLMEKTMRVLATLSELRIPYYEGQGERTGALARAIAKQLHLELTSCQCIYFAALARDIGMLHLTQDVLMQPGPLSPDEWTLIHEHPQQGSAIVADIPCEGPLSRLILQHHENQDGSGYPNGLSRDEILIEAAILRVADTVEAMIRERPYRPAHDVAAILKELNERSGTLYQPDVVDACTHLIRSGAYALQ